MPQMFDWIFFAIIIPLPSSYSGTGLKTASG